MTRVVRFDATAWRTILLSVLVVRRNRFGKASGNVFLGILLGLPAIAVAWLWSDPDRWRIGLGLFAVLAAVGLFAFWMLVVAHVAWLNTPAAAHLVPGHAARLRGALLQAWGALVAIACGVGAVFHAPLGAAVGTAVVLALLTMFVHLGGFGWLALVVLVAPDGLSSRVSGSLREGLSAVWAISPSATALLCLLLSGAVVAAAIPPGGSAWGAGAIRRAHRRPGRREQLAIGPATRHPVRESGRSAAWWPQPAPTAMARLVFGFESRGHWRLPILILVSLALVAAAVVRAPDLPGGLAIFGGLLAIGLSVAFARVVLGVVDVPALRGSEQALLRLLPGRPRGVDLSRALAVVLTTYWLALWACASVACALVADVPLPKAHWAVWPACVAMAILPLLPLGWRRWAHAPAPWARGGGARLVLLVASMGVAFGLVFVVKIGVVAVACAYAAIGVAGCAWRWFEMAREPEPLPMARLPR